jgi:hypothetical protein
MAIIRTAPAPGFRRFERRFVVRAEAAVAAAQAPGQSSNDLRLFATTFAAGFLFVSVFLF